MKQKPQIKLVGEDGNAFSILGRAIKALKRAGYTKEEIDQYQSQAKAGDYNELFRVTMEWCGCDSEEEYDEVEENELEFEEEGN